MTKDTYKKWTEGNGLKRGLPDADWAHNKFITVHPINYSDDEDGIVTEWKVTICWGEPWSHIVSGIDADFRLAMIEACTNAIKEGCPANWLPYMEE